MLPTVNDRYVRLPAVFESMVGVDPKKLFVITVAWNDAEMIALHHRALTKYLQDEYAYFVIDNSTDAAMADRTKEYCLQNRISYVRLPKNPGPDGSLHHGLALNWAYRHIILRYRPATFAIIDPDLFPTQDVRLGDYLDRGDAWGILTERRSWLTLWRLRSYLWIGLACFHLSSFRKRESNFLPGLGVDTGGRIPLDKAALMRLPDVANHITSPTVVIAPGVVVYKYGAFVHFTGAAWDSERSLAMKKKWMNDRLDS